jgi:hypothetical protein
MATMAIQPARKQSRIPRRVILKKRTIVESKTTKHFPRELVEKILHYAYTFENNEFFWKYLNNGKWISLISPKDPRYDMLQKIPQPIIVDNTLLDTYMTMDDDDINADDIDINNINDEIELNNDFYVCINFKKLGFKLKKFIYNYTIIHNNKTKNKILYEFIVKRMVIKTFTNKTNSK